MNRRIIEISGSDYERGVSIGKLLKESIMVNHINEETLYGGDVFNSWEKTTDKYTEMIEEYAPHTWAEVKGMADGSKLPLPYILAVATAYEKAAAADEGSGKCTSFAVTGRCTETGAVLCGQTNDERTDEWASDLDVVLKHKNIEGRSALIYTHPGVPAYMGMNDRGLAVQWTYIDNTQRNDVGLPTSFIIREILHMDTADEAISFLENIPHEIPNQFTIASREQQIASVECYPGEVYVYRDEESLVHANHIVTEKFKPLCQETLLGETSKVSTHFRHKRMEELINENKPYITVDKAKMFLADHKYYPLSICAHPYPDSPNWKTLASIVFDLEKLEMHIAFGNACEAAYQKIIID